MSRTPIYMHVTAKTVVALDEPPVTDRCDLWYQSSDFGVFVCRNRVTTIAGRHDEIRHASMVAVQDRNGSVGAMRYVRHLQSKKKVAKQSPKQLKLFGEGDNA